MTGDGVARLLVTTRKPSAVWMITCLYANWIEGRRNPNGETWLVTVFAEHRDKFLDAARRAEATVQEIDGAGDSETYRLIVGEPDTGWVKP